MRQLVPALSVECPQGGAGSMCRAYSRGVVPDILILLPFGRLVQHHGNRCPAKALSDAVDDRRNRVFLIPGPATRFVKCRDGEVVSSCIRAGLTGGQRSTDAGL